MGPVRRLVDPRGDAVILDVDGGVAGDGGPTSVAMTVDKPFLFAVVDEPSGAVLFLGHVEDPTDAGGP